MKDKKMFVYIFNKECRQTQYFSAFSLIDSLRVASVAPEARHG